VLKYYIDTCIWIDFVENRKGYFGENLARYAEELFNKIILQKDIIIISNIVKIELRSKMDKLKGIIFLLDSVKVIEKIFATSEDAIEAKTLLEKFNIPFPDALHFVLAKKHGAVLVTRDKHFNSLKKISSIKKPEELI
jgi:predicted nucleic acid-binding protein